MSTNAGKVIQRFFDAYRDHDVEAMVSLCREEADFNYPPVELWGRQRVLRADGKVRSVGKVLWAGLIDSFPDLGNEVTALHSDDDGHVAAEVTMSGTQAKVWGTIDSRGRRFAVPHLFLFDVGGDGLIDRVTAYWDSADMHRQLGRIEID